MWNDAIALKTSRYPMVSLRQLRAQFPKLLLVDAASTFIQVGQLSRARADQWRIYEGEAGVGVFAPLAAVNAIDAFHPEEADAFLFCEGPGSVLGIRTAAVSLRVWQMLRSRPTFAYSSLELVATFQLHAGGVLPFTVIADARRDSWHRLEVGEDKVVRPLRRGNLNTIQGLPISLREFRHWSPLPADTLLLSYDVKKFLASLEGEPLFRQVTEPDAFLHEEPSYVTWNPRIHRSPS